MNHGRPPRSSPCLLLLAASVAAAGEADIEAVRLVCEAGRNCSFHVSVRHADEGWGHYADHWRVLDPAGREITRRVLLHPHVEEQPFTRSLGAVGLPDGVSEVWVEAHDSVHGYGGKRGRASVPE